MKKNFVMTQSRDLASVIAFHLKQNKNVNIDRGVRRAGFMVLKAVSVPSVLVELGFISNSRESKLLGSSWYRVSIAESLAESIKSYLKKRDAGTGMPSLSGGGKKNSTKG
jgi:N-acetylmuramoyl-L-alanine amidase